MCLSKLEGGMMETTQNSISNRYAKLLEGSWFTQFCHGSNPWMARYVYSVLFLLANLLAWAVRDYGPSALTEMKSQVFLLYKWAQVEQEFVEGVMKLVELDNLRDALVGLPGVTGLYTERQKRLTVAVELVANPSIIFMDEPTSGLDARAAAIVVRTVCNTVNHWKDSGLHHLSTNH